MAKKTVLVLSLLTLFPATHAIAADKDDEGYSYQSAFLVRGKQSIESANTSSDIPLSLQYKEKMEKKAQAKAARSEKLATPPEIQKAAPAQHTTPVLQAAPVLKPAPVEAASATPAGTITTAPVEFSDSKPLMVIRFNQPNVYYHTPLYNAVKKALEIKPNANFEIHSLIPSTGKSDTDNNSKQTAVDNGKKLVESLASIGLPTDRVKIKYEGRNNVNSNEVEIFVR